MSTGLKRGDVPASISNVISWMQRNPGLRNHLGRGPIIIRDFRVPYLAGSSADGKVVYIDSQTPERLPKSKIEPDQYYARHEAAEWWLMTMIGLKYDPSRGAGAHPIAHGIERMAMRLDGIPDDVIEEYEQESAKMVSVDDHLKLPPEAFPPDLYLGPYLDEESPLDKRLIPILRQAQLART